MTLEDLILKRGNPPAHNATLDCPLYIVGKDIFIWKPTKFAEKTTYHGCTFFVLFKPDGPLVPEGFAHTRGNNNTRLYGCRVYSDLPHPNALDLLSILWRWNLSRYRNRLKAIIDSRKAALWS